MTDLVAALKWVHENIANDEVDLSDVETGYSHIEVDVLDGHEVLQFYREDLIIPTREFCEPVVSDDISSDLIVGQVFEDDYRYFREPEPSPERPLHPKSAGAS